MLSAMMVQIGLDKEESKDWPSLLPRVMFNLNTQRHSATKFSPFQLAFKQLPNLGNQVNEVEMTEESEKTKLSDEQTFASDSHRIISMETIGSKLSLATHSSSKSSIRKPPRRSPPKILHLSTSNDDTDDDASASIFHDQVNDLPCIKCHLCEARMSTASNQHLRACENCANWCCDFCLKNVVSSDEFLCNSCIKNKLKENRKTTNKKNNESESLSLRNKAGLNQDIARRRMCLKYNNKKVKTCFDFSIGDKVSVKVDKELSATLYLIHFFMYSLIHLFLLRVRYIYSFIHLYIYFFLGYPSFIHLFTYSFISP
jgi:hypothetical protein